MQGQTYERMHIKYQQNPLKEEGTTQMSLKMLHDDAQQDTDLPTVLLQSKVLLVLFIRDRGCKEGK